MTATCTLIRTSLPEAATQLASSDTVPAAAAAPAPADSATRAYEEGRYADAARLGLVEILRARATDF